MNEKEVKANLRSAIAIFCRWRVNHELCEPDECDFCPVNDAYDMAREFDDGMGYYDDD